jgi:hypothetical protein
MTDNTWCLECFVFIMPKYYVRVETKLNINCFKITF